jgi:hypothetical protein
MDCLRLASAELVIGDDAGRPWRRQSIPRIAFWARHPYRVARASLRPDPRLVLVDLADPTAIVAARARRHSPLLSLRLPGRDALQEVWNRRHLGDLFAHIVAHGNVTRGIDLGLVE